MTYDRSSAGDDAEYHAAVVLKALRLTREQPARSMVRSACESLVRFHERVAATGQPDSGRVAALLAQVREVLLPVAEQVRQWGIHALGNAQNGREEDRHDACLHRSAMALLLEQFGDIPEVARMTEEVDDFDEALRRMCDSYGPVPADERPRGLPADHWWWSCRSPPSEG